MTSLTDRIQRELDTEKEALVENLSELESKARDLADWRLQVRKHPLAAMGAAVAGGVALAMITGSRGARADESPQSGNGAPRRESIFSHPLVEQFVVTLATVAASRAADLFEERITPPTPPSRTDVQPTP